MSDHDPVDDSVPPREEPRCDCGAEGEDVDWVVDPYVEAMTRRVEWKWMCRRCYSNAVAEV